MPASCCAGHLRAAGQARGGRSLLKAVLGHPAALGRRLRLRSRRSSPSRRRLLCSRLSGKMWQGEAWVCRTGKNGATASHEHQGATCCKASLTRNSRRSGRLAEVGDSRSANQVAPDWRSWSLPSGWHLSPFELKPCVLLCRHRCS